MSDLYLCPNCRVDREEGNGACPDCGARLLPPEALNAVFAPPEEAAHPRTVGRYVLETLLGEGAMGSVWKAFDPQLNRPVALKILRGTEPEDVARMHREARIAAGLRHPNIVGVHDVGTADGQPFIAMDLVEGKRIDDQRLPARRVLELIREVSRALHYAHSRGVVHRDIKPGNILVDGEGRAYLSDFGLAKQTSLDSTMSLTGVVMGTPDYMSPEQAAGKSKQADARTDVWSLGATLYHLLSGQTPFDGATMYDVIRKVMEEEPPPLRRHNPRLHADIETIAMKCLEKAPERRYPDAAALAQDIDRFLNGEPIGARPASTLHRLTRKVAKNKAIVVALLALMTLSTATIVWATIERGRKRQRTDRIARADLLFAQDRFADAKAKYDEARGLGASVPEDRYARCVEEERRTQWLARRETELAPFLRRSEFALQRAREARKAGPPNYQAWREFVREAIRAIDEAIVKDDTWTTGYLARGRAKVEGNDLNGAIADFTLALDRNPRESLARYERGKAYLQKSLLEPPKGPREEREARDRVTGWLGKALEDFDTRARDDWKLEKEEAETFEVYQLFGNSRFEEAERRASNFLETRPDDAGLLLLRGAALYRLERYPESKVMYDRALKETGAHPFLFLFMARACGVLGDQEGRLRYYDRAVEMDPRFAIAYNNRGMVYFERGDGKKAREDLDRAMELDPGFAMAYNNRGMVRARLGDSDGAMADFTRALELDPETYQAYVNRAFLYGERKEWRRQVEDYGRVIALEPSIPDAWYSRGIAWHTIAREASGEERRAALVGAIADYEHFLTMAPDHPQIAAIRQRLLECQKMLKE